MNRKLVGVMVLCLSLVTGTLVTGGSDARADTAPTIDVPATSDIFAADLASVPAFDGGGGTLPPSVAVTPGAVITVSASGSIDCGGGAASGPDGSVGGGTVSIQSYGGISGADIPGGPICGLALAGVFTGTTPPADPAPARLNFVTGAGTSFTTLSPALDQAFFIGDGLKETGAGTSQTFVVPPGATTLWLGFQDGQSYTSPPGYYGDNTGSVSVNITVLSTLPGIDAGTFVSFRYLPGGGENCTTGFGVIKAGVKYETGAKHCIDGNNPNDNQEDLNTIAAHQPMTITGRDSGLVFASSIDCSPPVPVSCLLPTVIKGSTGDMMAWNPDTAIPTGIVQTGQGRLPVIGEKTASQVAGTRVCHYGLGSATNGNKNPERCDNKAPDRLKAIALCAAYSIYFRTNACPNETLPLAAAGFGGDSGGPVYQYAMSNGKAIGVYAVGIVVLAGGGATVYVPIRTVEQRLGATLLTQ